MSEIKNETSESEILREILEGDSNGSCSLSGLRTFRSWDCSWPTLTQPRRFTERNNYATDEPFFNTIRNHNYGVTHGLLEAVGAFEEDNPVVLYGGALVDIVIRKEKEIKDFDFRLIGKKYAESEEACVEAAKTFLANIFQWIRKENERIQIVNQKRKLKGENQDDLFDIQKVVSSRSKSTLTVIIPGREMITKSDGDDEWNFIGRTVLQFTFAPCETVQDLFNHSHPQCTRLAIKNSAVVLDKAAKYCLESLCVVLNEESLQSREIGTEMNRVRKYYDKGFDIILPKLDMKMLPVRNLKFNLSEALDLPELTVIYNKIEGNKIMVNRLELPNEQADVQCGGYDGNIDINVGESIHHNIRCLVADVYDQFQFVVEGEVTDSIFGYSPLLTGRMIDKSYETVQGYLTGGDIDINRVIQYFSATSPVEVFEKILIEKIRNKEMKPGVLPETIRFDGKDWDEVITYEKRSLLVKLKYIQDQIKDCGMDRLIFPFQKASTKEDVIKKFYGKYVL